MTPKTVTIELEDGLLVDGENTVTFVFANAYEGATGFSMAHGYRGPGGGNSKNGTVSC